MQRNLGMVRTSSVLTYEIVDFANDRHWLGQNSKGLALSIDFAARRRVKKSYAARDLLAGASQKKALSAVIGTSGRFLLLSTAVNDQYGLAVASMQKALRV
jgi:hypothetical protein